jgi:glycerol kinase
MIYLALDIGTHAVKAALFLADTARFGPQATIEMGQVFSADIALVFPKPRWVEQDPAELYTALKNVVQHALNTLENRGAEIGDTPAANGKVLSVAMAVQRSSVMLWQADSGQAISPILSWQDTRGHDFIEHLPAADVQYIQSITGLPASPHYGASKLYWLGRWHADSFLQSNLQSNLKSNHPQGEQVGTLSDNIVYGPLAAWLIKQLTGNNLCDPVNAARTLLLDRRKATWDARLCEIFGVLLSRLPSVVANQDQFGKIKDQIRPAPTKMNHHSINSNSADLCAVLGDQNAAYVAMRYSQLPEELNITGLGFQRPLILNIGSGAFVLGECDEDADGAALGLLTSLAFSTPSRKTWLLEGTVNGAGNALTAWQKSLPTLLEDQALFEQLPAWLAADTGECLYLYTDAGLGSPFWCHSFKPRQGNFFDLDGHVIEPLLQHQAVAVIESIAFLLVLNIEQMSKQTSSQRYDGIIATGGLARLNGLIERIAQLCGLPIFVAQCYEATLQGAAILASNFSYKPCLAGNIVAAKQSCPVFRHRYNRYIQLIKDNQS